MDLQHLRLTPLPRKGRVLTKADFGCLNGIPTVNITRGCLFQCVYCYARGYAQAPPDGEVQLYTNLPDLLESELPRKREIPPWAAINTASDCFQPHPDILRITHRTMEILLEWGIGISFLTKGEIPQKFLRLFQKFPGKVLAQIGLVSISDRYQEEYEPYAAPPESRIRNIQNLKDLGILPEVRLDPIIPFVTDGETEIFRLLEKIRETGVKRVTLSYLHLRPQIHEQFIREVSPLHRKIIEACFHSQGWKVVGASTQTKLLPRPIREKGYERIRKIAETCGIEAVICRCKNPDLRGEQCGSGRTAKPAREKTPAQLSLFRC